MRGAVKRSGVIQFKRYFIDLIEIFSHSHAPAWERGNMALPIKREI